MKFHRKEQIRYGNLTWLHTDGKYIKSEYNQTVFLRGAAFGDLTSLTGWQGGHDLLVRRVNQFVNLSEGKSSTFQRSL